MQVSAPAAALRMRAAVTSWSPRSFFGPEFVGGREEEGVAGGPEHGGVAVGVVVAAAFGEGAAEEVVAAGVVGEGGLVVGVGDPGDAEGEGEEDDRGECYFWSVHRGHRGHRGE